MPNFFSRPVLENQQFKQLPGSILTLSGQTQIATTSGLTLTDGVGGYVPIILTGGTEFDVLTYRGGKMVLQPLSGSTGSGIYSGASPTTCTVGGLPATTAISGCSISKILELILVPTLNPNFTPPSASLSLAPPTPLLYEVGCNINITSTITFNQGVVAPVYCGGPSTRTGVATCYAFSTFNSAFASGVTNSSVNAGVIGLGSNNFSGIVAYGAGSQALNSIGGNYGTVCPASNMSAGSIALTGIYPWFYGKSVSAPVAGQALINTGGKCVGVSSGVITVSNYAASSEYVWFAIPTGSTSKTVWQGANNVSNNGPIPGALFPSVSCMTVSSPSGCWTNVGYKFYIGGYPTSINYGMTFCN